MTSLDSNNLPSARVVEKNGGLPDGTSVSPVSGDVMVRYWIDLGVE